MAVELFAGAALGVAFDKLVKVVVKQRTRITGFNKELKRLETTLTDIKPKLIKITELRDVLGCSEEEKITRYLMDAGDLVLKCSKVKWWNKSGKAKRLIRLDDDLVRFFQVNAQADAIINGMETSIEMGIMHKKLDQLLAVGTGGLSNVPRLGLDVPLAESKSRMLEEETCMSVVSAPEGCGKTTLEDEPLRLLNEVIEQTSKTARSSPIVKRLLRTLERIEPRLNIKKNSSERLGRTETEIEMFVGYLQNAKELILKYSGIRVWNVYKNFVYTKKLMRLEDKLFRLFQIDIPLSTLNATMSVATQLKILGEKIDRIYSLGPLSDATTRAFINSL